MDLGSWDSVAPLLAQQFTVLRFDRRSFGKSTAEASLRGDREDALALFDQLHIDRAIVLGMSQGARVALDIAVSAPHRARALILDAAPLIDAEPELPLEEYRRLRDETGMDAMRASIATHPLMQLSRDLPEAQRTLSASLDRYHGRDLDVTDQPRITLRATDVTVPSLILVGELDSAARREAAQLLHARIKGSYLTHLAGAGHLAALDDPFAYAAAVAGFCQRLPG
jgi:3-oxoadipate enol-lactonase